MRLIALVAALATVALAGGGAASGATTPTLRIAPSATLSIVGAGFRPRSVVTIRVVTPGADRTASVRTGIRGGFTIRLPALERCEPTVVVARAGNGATARVPVAWFARDCLPPPPMQPGIATS
jgi:hypothetical protein